MGGGVVPPVRRDEGIEQPLISESGGGSGRLKLLEGPPPAASNVQKPDLAGRLQPLDIERLPVAAPLHRKIAGLDPWNRDGGSAAQGIEGCKLSLKTHHEPCI